MTTHSSILSWRIPWTEEPGRLQFMGLKWVRHGYVPDTFTFTFRISSDAMAWRGFWILCVILTQVEIKGPYYMPFTRLLCPAPAVSSDITDIQLRAELSIHGMTVWRWGKEAGVLSQHLGSQVCWVYVNTSFVRILDKSILSCSCDLEGYTSLTGP